MNATTNEESLARDLAQLARGGQAALAVAKKIADAYVSGIRAVFAKPQWQRIIRGWEDSEFIRREADRHRRELRAELNARMDRMYAEYGLERKP